VIVGQPIKREFVEAAIGDARHTSADVAQAREFLNYQPKVDLKEGLRLEWDWVRSLYE
jgi:UDP-glucose 4-epimerase